MNGTLVALAFVLLFVLLFMGVPIGTSLGIPVAILVAATQITSFEYIAQFLYTKIADFTMLSLPFFLLAGDIMDGGGLSKRMVAVANSLIGNVTGALGAVTVIACMFFGAVSGSAPATVAAIGTIMIPQMVYDGYDKGYAVGLVCVAGGLGIIVPPSFPMVLYGVTNGVSIGDMFLAGWGPSFVVGGVLIFINWLICKKRGYKSPIPKETSLKLFVKSVWEGKWALLMPIIILGGIFGGIFTPTEASAVAVVYSLIISLFVYKDMSFKELPQVFVEGAVSTATIMVMVGLSSASSYVITTSGLPQQLVSFFSSITNSPVVILLLLNILFLIIGMLMEANAAVVMMTPILLPLLNAFGIDLLQFGIVMSFNLCIGLVTPPVGLCLLLCNQTGETRLSHSLKAMMPMLLISIIVLVLITYVSPLTTLLPSIMAG